ncbi:MAG: hypothetical protein A7316_06075 [Candidatus Altiarchaeales archaeon WOR_SM1_86-2]|nr:MAG: hypothetical protein A7316_06075 [Candidatus Altiarchaeales archaeon WOR_SM1_86-2]ODS41369.1 MAG: hypothetical protein A7315_06430 [Candidatus Altiarchaeales archaeon WOR_SM1_79]
MYYLSHAPKNEETPVHLKYYQDPGVGRHLPKSEGAAGTCRTKNRATLGAVLFAFGTFLLLLSPIWGVEHFERIILTVITGGLILAYGLFRIVT